MKSIGDEKYRGMKSIGDEKYRGMKSIGNEKYRGMKRPLERAIQREQKVFKKIPGESDATGFLQSKKALMLKKSQK